MLEQILSKINVRRISWNINFVFTVNRKNHIKVIIYEKGTSKIKIKTKSMNEIKINSTMCKIKIKDSFNLLKSERIKQRKKYLRDMRSVRAFNFSPFHFFSTYFCYFIQRMNWPKNLQLIY